jgi:hypothetical protein
MSIGTRAASCSSCSKRLNRKQWYYRNGKYYCKKRCWVTENEKAATEAQKEGGKESGKAEAAKEAKEAPAPS